MRAPWLCASAGWSYLGYVSSLAVAVFAGASGRGKSALLNDLYRASKISAAEYAARAAEAAAAAGPQGRVETFTPGPHEEWAPPAPKLEPKDVHAGLEVEVYIPLDMNWIPGKRGARCYGRPPWLTICGARRTRAGGAHAWQRDGGARGRVRTAARRRRAGVR